MRALTVPAGHYQGITSIDDGGKFWLEEYPGGRPPIHTLNGGIFAIWSVLDWYFYTGESSAENMYRAFIHSLIEDLPSYDTGSWTYYDGWGYMATQGYHEIHIRQMNKLYLQTGLEVFAHYRDTWQGYLDDRLID